MSRKQEDKIKTIRPVGRFGGSRLLQRRIGRSETLGQNKEAVATELRPMGTACRTYIIDHHSGQVKPLEDIPEQSFASNQKVPVGQPGTPIGKIRKVRVLQLSA